MNLPLKTQPLVSVVIPTYNRAHLISETIESAIQQTYKNWELIIIDDGSDDDTESVIKSFNNTNIIYHRIEHSGILGKVRNHGIRIAKGEYIAFLDSDDLWISTKLESQLALLQKYPETHFSFCNSNQFGEGAISTPDYESIFVGKPFYAILFQNKFSICMPSLIFSSRIIDQIGTINENWKGGGDVEFFYRLSYHYKAVFTNERLVNIRRHFQSTSQKLGDTSYTELLQMFEIFYRDKWLSRKQRNVLVSNIYYRMGLDHLERKQTASKYFYKFVTLRPLHLKGWGRLLYSIFRSKSY